MHKIVLTIAAIAAVVVIGIAVYLSQLGLGDPPAGNESGTTVCAPRESAAPDPSARPETAEPGASDRPAGDSNECEVQGRGGKPGEAPKE